MEELLNIHFPKGKASRRVSRDMWAVWHSLKTTRARLMQHELRPDVLLEESEGGNADHVRMTGPNGFETRLFRVLSAVLLEEEDEEEGGEATSAMTRDADMWETVLI